MSLDDERAAIHAQLDYLAQRITEHEERVRVMIDPTPHDLDKRLALIEQQFKDMREELRAIAGNLSKLVWAVAAAIIAGFMQWIIRGGLNA